MPTFAAANIPTPKGWDEFEDIVLSIAKIRWGISNFCRHGRQGQKQDGVDVYGEDKEGRLIALQCKNTVEGVSEKTIADEIKSAESFKPNIDWLYIATTAKSDYKTQKFVREISEKRVAAGKFPIDILFWGDLCNDLTSDADRLYQHYPQLTAPPGTQKQPHDQQLFDEFRQVLPFDPTIRLLREHAFGDAFRRADIQPLFNFVETWNSVEKEFNDESLEEARKALYAAANELSLEIVKRTVPIGDQRYASVLSDQVRAQGGPRPDWVREDARVLDNVATAFVPVYENFVRLCRKTLSK